MFRVRDNSQHPEVCSWLQPQLEGGAARVSLFDITRGLPQRIEGNYRRHWAFAPALWNLYFRERVNLGVSLKTSAAVKSSQPVQNPEIDAATAAASLYKRLATGTYRDASGKRRRINMDTSKLPFAHGISRLEKNSYRHSESERKQ